MSGLVHFNKNMSTFENGKVPSGRKTVIINEMYFFKKMGHLSPLFHFVFVFSNKHVNFHNKCMWKMAIQYLVQGFEPTTFRTWVSSNNHYTMAPALTETKCLEKFSIILYAFFTDKTLQRDEWYWRIWSDSKPWWILVIANVVGRCINKFTMILFHELLFLKPVLNWRTPASFLFISIK